MEFFRQHDYGGSFLAENHEIVYQFLSEAKNPDFEFLDERMQGCFETFRNAAEAVRDSWHNRLWLDDHALKQGQRILQIPIEWIEGRPEQLQLERYAEAKKAMNASADAFFAAYVDFIRVGRRILVVT